MNPGKDNPIAALVAGRVRFTLGDTQRFLLLSILIGLFAGLLVVCFHIMIDSLNWYLLGTPPGANRAATIFSPALGAAASSLLVLFVFRQAQGSGVNHTKAALYISDGYIPFSTVLGKFLACSVSIGSGNSLGPEDPALQMGAGVGSLLGRSFQLTKEHMRLISPVGAAAGIAAAFNTPITAVLFVIEEVVASWNAAVLGSIVLSAVSAVVVSRWFLGNEPLFRVPGFDLTHPSELIVYAAVGLLGGLLAAGFVKAIVRLRRWLHTLPRWSRHVQPVAAGLAIGCTGLWLPQVMGAGYDAVDSALHNQFAWNLLLLLAIVKILATLLCFAVGIPGGMFAPTLFTGAMIGGGLGGLAQIYSPFPASPAGAYVLVGMGTFFAGVFRAPMTSIFMVFEVSASYVIILPVMIANTLAYLVSRQLQTEPFFDVIAREEGMALPSHERQREQRQLCVEDAMEPVSAPVVDETATVSHALALCRRRDSELCLVRSDKGDWWFVRCEALGAACQDPNAAVTLAELPTLEALPTVFRDISLDTALRLLGSKRLLPVLSRANRNEILGVVTLAGIHRAYGIETS